MRDLCAIFYGQIQTIDVVGAYPLVVLATLLARYYTSVFMLPLLYLFNSKLLIYSFVSPGHIGAV
jgi:hypothetical protein